MNPIFYSITTMASVYNCGSYGAGTYNDGTGTCITGSGNGSGTGSNTGTSTSTSGGLANTGMNVILPLAGGVILIVLALVLLFSTLKRRKK
jgi:hypothetical protein